MVESTRLRASCQRMRRRVRRRRPARQLHRAPQSRLRTAAPPQRGMQDCRLHQQAPQRLLVPLAVLRRHLLVAIPRVWCWTLLLPAELPGPDRAGWNRQEKEALWPAVAKIQPPVRPSLPLCMRTPPAHTQQRSAASAPGCTTACCSCDLHDHSDVGQALQRRPELAHVKLPIQMPGTHVTANRNRQRA